MNSIQGAQKNMREAYYAGAPGIFVSGTVWLFAAGAAGFSSPMAGVLTLIFGGMAIFPLSVLLCKIIGCTGKHEKGNGLAPLAIEGTVWMLLSILIAVGVAYLKVEWFFPIMLLVIGGRYLTFSTLYGMRIYWLFGAVLAAVGMGLIVLQAPVFVGALLGGLVEFIFGVVIAIIMRNKNQVRV